MDDPAPPGPLAGLREEEQLACVVAERVLGATARPYDLRGVPGNGRVDALLELPGGRSAAFEVMGLFSPDTRAVAGRLAREGYRWPAAGRWLWRIAVGSSGDLHRLKRVYVHVAGLCEAAGVETPERLASSSRSAAEVDPEVRWLVEESSSRMWGFPSIPAAAGGRDRGTQVTPPSRSGFVDSTLTGLRAALVAVFDSANVARHRTKLVAHVGPVEERHLFLWVDPLDPVTPLPFDVADGLASGTVLPVDPPELPGAITHLWLAPVWRGRVLLAVPAGWSQHYPYDEA